jgi:hypothetical protein
MLADDRRRAGWSVEQAARRPRVSVCDYRALERTLDWETWDRICETFRWPQTFAHDPRAAIVKA